MKQTVILSLLLFSLVYSHPIQRRSYASPEGTHHGKSDEYFHSIRSQSADSLKDRFNEHYAKIITNGKQNGYFSQDSVPYHSVETLVIDENSVDYGHVSTSEAYSEYIWLTAMNIWANGDTTDFKTAWQSLETYMIPSSQNQPTCSSYDPSGPSSYEPQEPSPCDYPVEVNRNVKIGQDDLNDELAVVYGSGNKIIRFYATHWLLDVDNIYGFGNHESGSASNRNVYIDTYRRGQNESVWKTIPHPSWELFKYCGHCGFQQFFVIDTQYACDERWDYIGTPTADTRTIQATYWAYNFSNNGVSLQVQKAVQLSDFIRYSMFDQYFKNVPCYSPNCPAVTFQNGWNATFYLISWFLAWGGPVTDTYWGMRMGSSQIHQGHQNALTAYILSTVSAFESKTSGGKGQWTGVRYKTIDFWEWLQSEEGAIAGGATNSYNGQYGNPAKGGITGYFSNGLSYQWEPTFHVPPSNDWFGWQCFSQERNAEYCYLSGDGRACSILKKWVSWIISLKNEIILTNNDYQVPNNLSWSGQPNNYTGSPHINNNLHVSVIDYSKDVGVASTLAHTLTYYAAATGDAETQSMARELLDRIYMYADHIGIGVNESRPDYLYGFWQTICAVGNCTYPNGNVLTYNSTFIDIREWYKNDPSWIKIEQAKQNGVAPIFVYHRMWAQSEFGIATADYARLFGNSSIYAVQDKDLYFNDPHYKQNTYYSMT